MKKHFFFKNYPNENQNSPVSDHVDMLPSTLKIQRNNHSATKVKQNMKNKNKPKQITSFCVQCKTIIWKIYGTLPENLSRMDTLETLEYFSGFR